MYLKKIKIYNFRKFKERANGDPGLEISFNENFNLLIGENDSGKTAIIDAIRLTLGTISMENPRITEEDFFNEDSISVDYFKIECIFSGLNDQEAGMFLEWLSFNKDGDYELLIRLNVRKLKNGLTNRFDKSIKAGPENADMVLEGKAKEVLQTTYLKPLRDADSELRPGLRSRLAQILQGHSAFKTNEGEIHELEEILNAANKKIESYFDSEYADQKASIKEELVLYLNEFFSKTQKPYDPNFEVSSSKLSSILRKLALILEENVSGLGSLNLLFIAAELLLLNDKNEPGPSLTLIEEIEAHLHPQAQLRLIKYLQETLSKENINGQFILSTHSTSLAASISLDHLILMHGNFAYPLSKNNTNLSSDDYKFLERFLDVTKSNLFFAKGVILVEGDAENLLVPALAEIIERPLHKYGVSIVNLGSTAFKRYTNIFSRSPEWYEKELPPLKLPVSLITDSDIKPFEYYAEKSNGIKEFSIDNQQHLVEILKESGIEIEENKFQYEDLNKTRFSKISDMKKMLNETYDITELDLLNDDILIGYTQKDVDESYISKLENERIASLKEKYSNDTNLKVFVAPHWTLEYMLSMSSLNHDLVTVIHEARYKYPYNGSNLKKYSNLIDMLENPDISKNQKAYKIFKPVNDKHVSKAIVAQELATKLIGKEDKKQIKKIVEDDERLSYLVEAIYHVTEPK